jgi:hypothetical protein
VVQLWMKKNTISQRFLKTKEGIFFRQHRRLFLQYPTLRPWFFVQRPFAMIQANILLRGFLQKQIIDDYLKTQAHQSIHEHGRIKHHWIRDRFHQHMQFIYTFQDHHDQPIILPFFNRALNFIYRQEPDKLFDYPYNRLDQDFVTVTIDAFEQYGWRLFASNFTTLINLGIGDQTAKAFYDRDAALLFIINIQGREDAMIALDYKFKKKFLHLDDIQSLKQALPFYFSHDRQQFINALAAGQLLTARQQQKLLSDKPQRLILR